MARKPAARAPERSKAPVLPPDILRGSHVGLVTGDAALVSRAMNEAERRGVRLRVARPDDDQTLGDLVWGCELVIVGRDARDDERAQRVLRSARDILELRPLRGAVPDGVERRLERDRPLKIVLIGLRADPAPADPRHHADAALLDGPNARLPARRPSLSSQRSITSEALWPPKPNPLESPTRRSTPCRATLGT